MNKNHEQYVFGWLIPYICIWKYIYIVDTYNSKDGKIALK